MSHRSARLAFLGLGAFALASCVAFVCIRPGSRLSAAQIPAPSFKYVSVWSDSLDQQTQTLYQSLADAIAGFNGVPNARSAYYSYYNDGINWTIGSWSGDVFDATPDGNGGYNVKLIVGPNDFTMIPQGSGERVDGGYYEIFNVDANGNVTYVNSFDPEGWAGGQLIESS